MTRKLTPVRQAVLDTLEAATLPVTASILHHQLDQYDLSTIYRALEFLESLGLIESLSFFGGERFYYAGRGHGHFLLCQSCHEIIPFDDCAAMDIQERLAERYGYAINQHSLTFQGLCPHCQQVQEMGA